MKSLTVSWFLVTLNHWQNFEQFFGKGFAASI